MRLVLVIECSLRRAFQGMAHSKAQPRAIIKTVFSLWVRYGLVPVFCADRAEMAEFIKQYYLAEWRKMEAECA